MPDDSPVTESVPMPRPVLLPVAPTWHTVVLLVAIAVLSGLSAHTHRVSIVGFSHGAIYGYLFVMVTQWLVFAYIWFGIRLGGGTLRALIGERWPKWISAFRDLGIAVAFLLLATLILGTVAHILHADGREVAKRLQPHGAAEITVYLLLCLTAGFCEEIMFRGYLMRQFSAWTQSATAGLLLQALVFGAGHGYQGLKLMGVITVFGCLFALLAMWQRSLRPGMMAHSLQDSLVVLLGRFVR
jgi:uncharacterized protein